MNRGIRIRLMTFLVSITFISFFIFFIFLIISKGINLLNMDLIRTNYNTKSISLTVDQDYKIKNNLFINPHINNTCFSSKFGFSIMEEKDLKNEKQIKIVHIDKNSPLYYLKNKENNVKFNLNDRYYVASVIMRDKKNEIITTYSNDKLEFIKEMELGESILNLQVETKSGGIKGSIITTIYLILMVLTISIPLSLLTAIFISEYIKNKKLKNNIYRLFDILLSIPTIIYGLIGITFISPLIDSHNLERSEPSLLTASIVLSIIIIPLLIKNFINSLGLIEKDFREQVSALGIKKYQMIFICLLKKIKLEIIFNVILSTTKVIGETSGLIFILGTVIKDEISIFKQSSSLSLHIYALMCFENPNYELVCTLSLIILIIMIIITLFLKIIEKKWRQRI